MATAIGILFGITLLLGVILTGGSAQVFLNLQALMIVLGGTVAATLISFTFSTVFNIFRVSVRLFRMGSPDLGETVSRLVELSHRASRESVLALEKEAKEESNPYIAMGLNLLLRSAPPDRIERRYAIESEGVRARHARGIRLFTVMAKVAPSFGLVGTLIGLILMLQGIKSDLSPDTLGPSMAIAMVTTLYGALFSFLFFLPAAEKLKDASAQEVIHINMVRDGILMIQDSYPPRELEQMLSAYLSHGKRRSVVDELVMEED